MTSARKIKLKLNTPAPRNPLVAPALKRKAGVHRKSKGGQRQAARREVREALGKEGRPG